MGRRVFEKLGIKEDLPVLVVDAPGDYDAIVESPPFEIQQHQGTGDCKFIHLFCAFALDLESKFPNLMSKMTKDGSFWVSWPKGSSKLPRDINDHDIRELGRSLGLIDVKVCAIDKDWSGLKFMYRREDR